MWLWLGSNAREGTHVVPCKIMEDFDQMMPELHSFFFFTKHGRIKSKQQSTQVMNVHAKKKNNNNNNNK
jgi:hypothetical protein